MPRAAPDDASWTKPPPKKDGGKVLVDFRYNFQSLSKVDTVKCSAY